MQTQQSTKHLISLWSTDNEWGRLHFQSLNEVIDTVIYLAAAPKQSNLPIYTDIEVYMLTEMMSRQIIEFDATFIKKSQHDAEDL